MLNKFPDNSRVAFIGDSITAENLALQWIIRAYKQFSRGIRFVNCGVAGGTAEFAVISYDKDIKRYAPTHAVVSFGINDSMRELLNEKRSPERLEALTAAYENYKRKLAQLVDRLVADGAEVTLCTPVPYDEYSDSDTKPLAGGYALMLGYAEYVRALAKEKGVQLYDQHRILSEVMAGDTVHSSDRIHPTQHGYYILAREFLGAQGIDAGAEDTFPQGYALWHSYVARLRKVLASECMLIPRVGESFDSPTDVKLEKMRQRVERREYDAPVFESFFLSYVNDKPLEQDLYRMIDEEFEKIK